MKRTIPATPLKFLTVSAMISASLSVMGCELFGKGSSSSSNVTSGQPGPTPSGEKYLYVTSGSTYVGAGVTTDVAVQTVSRYRLNGTFDRVVFDYNRNAGAGDQPVDIVNYDQKAVLVLVENSSGGRRIDRVNKDGSGTFLFIQNLSALNGVLRSFASTFDGGWLVSKSSAIEKFSSNRGRVTPISATAYVNNPQGACAATNTLVTEVLQGPGNTIIYLHAGASPNNKVALVKSSGYVSSTDCLSTVSAPSAAHLPTAALMHSNGRLLVAYSTGAATAAEIYSYPITSTSIGSGTLAYTNLSVLKGVTSMIELPDSTIAVASAAVGYNAVDQFSYDVSTDILSRVGTTPMIFSEVYLRSISALMVAD
ncbi:MAG: hypothetical protein RJB38_958 [Pseudomonadota bacterium]|jgi:hypothetical protein